MPIVLLLFLAFQTTADAAARLRDQWARNLHDKRIEASIASYTADADFINPDGTRIHGTQALRGLFKSVTSAYDSDLVFTSQRVETSGDLTYDVGSYREDLTSRSSRKTQQITGSYLTIYRRSANGSWLIVEQMWTVSKPSSE